MRRARSDEDALPEPRPASPGEQRAAVPVALAAPRPAPPPTTESDAGFQDAIPGDVDLAASTIGRFSIGAELGRGGMGHVLNAWDPDLQRTVALKLMLDPEPRRPARAVRFLSEARIAAQLDHPGIVPVHELGATEDGRPFFVMKRVGGRSLRQVLALLSEGDAGARQEWSRHRLLTVFVQVCNAVAYAHDRGIVHRDLKPDNIMLGDYGEAMVMDWGLARPMDGRAEAGGTGWGRPDGVRTSDGAIIGTPGYMSPEQARRGAEGVDGRADVWSLGAMLYEMLTFQRAWPPAPRAELILKSAGGPPEDPRLRAPEQAVPDEIAEVCLKALAPEAADRYPTARALAEAVDAFLEGSRRRERALTLVEEARRMLAAAARRRTRATSCRAEAEERLRAVPAYAPDTAKAVAWDLQDQSDRENEDADRLETEAEERLHHALSEAPGLPEARAALADLHRGRMSAAEAVRDRRSARHHERMLRAYDDGAHAAFLRGDGAITLMTDPPGAEVLLCRLVERRRRLVPEVERELGSTPLVEVPLLQGSYVLRLRAPGRVEVRYPVHVPRNHHWDGVGPGETGPRPVYLPRPEELGPDDLYVPSGWFLAGGDPQAPGSIAAARLWVDGFVLRRFPVTNREYLAFLDALVERGDDAAALLHAPRERAGTLGEVGAMIYGRDADGRFQLVRDADGDPWLHDAPVVMVDWAGARAFAEFTRERAGQPWRLASEWEREKAARGVDGRCYPWGDFLDPSWCCMRDSHAGKPVPARVDRFPGDESLYGVRGLAGNVRDWCLDPWAAGGAVEDGSRASVPVSGGDSARVVRGGSYAGVAALSRASSRHGHAVGIRNDFLGFRLARSLG